MNLYFFDFDNTLVKRPSEYLDNNKDLNDEYMDSKESLNFEFEPNSKVCKHLNKPTENDLKILLTNRNILLKDEVLSILNDMNITFDHHLFREENRSKGDRMIKFINSLGNKINNVYFWDDKLKHIVDVREKLIDLNINFELTLIN